MQEVQGCCNLKKIVLIKQSNNKYKRSGKINPQCLSYGSIDATMKDAKKAIKEINTRKLLYWFTPNELRPVPLSHLGEFLLIN